MNARHIVALAAGAAILLTWAPADAKRKRRSRSSHAAWSMPTPRKIRSESQDGNCSCSGSHVCVGPRGGTYCITSGGRKRYV